MATERRFKTDLKRVVHETIDGETILIQLETGVYYSLRGSGPTIWRLLLAGWSEAEITDEVRARSKDGASSVEDATHDLIHSLEAEALIVEDEAGASASPTLVDTGSEPFERPLLERYTDMQNYLLLDPVHEVADAGWPHEQSVSN